MRLAWRRFPVATLAVGVLVLAFTFQGVYPLSGAPLEMSYRAFADQPWRLVSPALLHLDMLRLMLPLFWFLTFGAAIELRWGSLRTLGLILLFTASTTAAEYALLDGTAGLGGVAFGLFGLLWVLSRKDDDFRGALGVCGAATIVGWLMFCMALAFSGNGHPGVVAQVAGFVFGVALGMAARADERLRPLWAGIASVLLAGSAFLATTGRPAVNLSAAAGRDVAADGAASLRDGDYARAVVLYERAVALKPTQAGWWYDLGVAYSHRGREYAAFWAHQRAYELAPSEPRLRRAYAASAASQGGKRLAEARLDEAVRLLEIAVHLDDKNAAAWNNLGRALTRLKAGKRANEAFEHAEVLARRARYDASITGPQRVGH